MPSNPWSRGPSCGPQDGEEYVYRRQQQHAETHKRPDHLHRSSNLSNAVRAVTPQDQCHGHDKWQILLDLSGRLWSNYLAARRCVALCRWRRGMEESDALDSDHGADSTSSHIPQVWVDVTDH